MTKSLKSISIVVILGTLISKAGGLARQLVIAGAFGVGAAYDAYNYAYVIPGFFLILLGGINGPFHNAMVSSLTGKDERESSYILSAINTMVTSALLLLTAILVVGAEQLIHLVGPALSPEIHDIAVLQLKIMAPLAVFSGLIGLGFGALNANNEFLIPSISPVLSSIVLISFVGSFWLIKDGINESIDTQLAGGIILAVATLIGAFSQWIVQIPSLVSKGLFKIKFIWDLGNQGIKDVWKIIIPATFSSGMLQINVFIDLFFASSLVGAAAGLSYANFLVQTPLGLISNALIIPLLPVFAKLSRAGDQKNLIKRLKQGLMLSSASMIAIGAIFITLGEPIVELIYARGAFDKNAVNLVSGLLIAYGIGMPLYLARDLLVRVFYALGDGQTPFRLSTAGIGLNALFDWFLIGGPSPWGNQLPFNFGAPGLVIATVAVNFITCGALIFTLNIRLNGLPIKSWCFDGVKLLIAGSIAGAISWTVGTVIHWPNDLIGELSRVVFSSSASLLSFGITGNLLKIKEIQELSILIRKKLSPP